MIDAPGIYDMPHDAYQADPCSTPSLRSSLAWQLVAPGSTPAHAFHGCVRINPDAPPRENKKYFDIGQAAHAMLLGKGAQYKVIMADDWRSKEAQAARRVCYAQGQTPILEKEEAKLQDMVRAARRQFQDLLEAGTISRLPFQPGDTEKVIIWNEGQVTCRAMLDGLPEDGGELDEYKTADCADPQLWSWQARKLGYAFRLRYYARGLESLGINSPHMQIFVQEKEPPYLLSLVRVDDELIMREDERVRKAIKIWGDCLRSGRWPGYSLEGYDLTLTERERAQSQQMGEYNSGHVSSEEIAGGL